MRRFAVVLFSAALFAATAFVGTTSAVASPLNCFFPQVLTTYTGTINWSGGLTTQQDVWGPRDGTKQTMYVCGVDNWEADVTQNGDPSAGVTTYPDSGTTYPDTCADTHKLSEIATLSSTYAEIAPTAHAAWDYGYDLFLGGGLCGETFQEVMVWNAWTVPSVPTPQLTRNVGGVDYDIYYSPDLSYVQVRRHVQNASGTVNLGAILAVLAYNGIVADAHLVFTQFGVEVLSTCATYGTGCTGSLVKFYTTDFSVTETLK
jgi:hypothetical protein